MDPQKGRGGWAVLTSAPPGQQPPLPDAVQETPDPTALAALPIDPDI